MTRLLAALGAAGLVCAMVSPSAWADGDPAKGKRVFNKCRTCHELTKEKNKIGPHLVGILGRKSGSVEGFRYSSAMKNANIVWSETTIDEYIADPKKYVPGNKMVLAPIKKAQQRADLIAYLKEQQKK